LTQPHTPLTQTCPLNAQSLGSLSTTPSQLLSCPSQSSGLDGADTADDGEVTIRACDLPGAAGCEVTVRLRRERDGSLGAGWQDGSVMMAAQQREVAFTLTP